MAATRYLDTVNEGTVWEKKAISINARHSFAEWPFNSDQSLLVREQNKKGLPGRVWAISGLGLFTRYVAFAPKYTKGWRNLLSIEPLKSDIKSRYFAL